MDNVPDSNQAMRFSGRSRKRRNLDSDLQKFSLTATPTHRHIHLVSSLHEGRIAIVTDVGWDAVDAAVTKTNVADAYGKDVWS
jgi:hypothetical protein